MTSSGTNTPAAMYAWALRPKRGAALDVGAEDVAVEIAGIPRPCARRSGLSALARTGRAEQEQHALLKEPFVVALLQLSLDALDGVETDADEDED